MATRGIAVLGPDAEQLGVQVDVGERISWVRENVDTYWRGVAAQLRGALDRSPEQQHFDADAIEWCALGIAQMLLTSTTGEVASKSAAGEWAAQILPHHAMLLHAAVAIRGRHDRHEQVDRSVVLETTELLDEVVAAVTG